MKHGLVVAILLAIFLPQPARGDWTIEVVADDIDADVGYQSSLAFDSTDRPCVTYYDETHGELRFACRDGAGAAWPVLSIVPNDDPRFPNGYVSDLDFFWDGGLNEEIAHVAYRRGVDVMSVLRYARKVGDGPWEDETLDNQAQGVGHNISMSLDLSGRPHISHLKSWGQATVKYVGWDGSSWQGSTVFNPSSDYSLGDADLSLDQSGKPLVAIIGMGDGASLELARRVGTKKWKSTPIDGATQGESVSFVIDPLTGAQHVVWATNNWVDEPNFLYHTFRSGPDDPWAAALEIDRAAVWERFDFLDMALDESSLTLHLAYYDSSAGVLKYTRMIGGVWDSPEVVDASADVGLYPSVAVAGGHPHITYHDATHARLLFAAYSDSVACTSDSDCDDLNGCTADTCAEDGTCAHDPVAQDTPCDLGGEQGICCGGGCVSAVCATNDDCNDGVPGYTVFCRAGEMCDAYCETVCSLDWPDGICPPECSAVDDIDCPDCGAITDRKTCQADPLCEWDARNKRCEFIGN